MGLNWKLGTSKSGCSSFPHQNYHRLVSDNKSCWTNTHQENWLESCQTTHMWYGDPPSREMAAMITWASQVGHQPRNLRSTGIVGPTCGRQADLMGHQCHQTKSLHSSMISVPSKTKKISGRFVKFSMPTQKCKTMLVWFPVRTTTCTWVGQRNPLGSLPLHNWIIIQVIISLTWSGSAKTKDYDPSWSINIGWSMVITTALKTSRHSSIKEESQVFLRTAFHYLEALRFQPGLPGYPEICGWNHLYLQVVLEWENISAGGTCMFLFSRFTIYCYIYIYIRMYILYMCPLHDTSLHIAKTIETKSSLHQLQLK